MTTHLGRNPFQKAKPNATQYSEENEASNKSTSNSGKAHRINSKKPERAAKGLCNSFIVKVPMESYRLVLNAVSIVKDRFIQPKKAKKGHKSRRTA